MFCILPTCQGQWWKWANVSLRNPCTLPLVLTTTEGPPLNSSDWTVGKKKTVTSETFQVWVNVKGFEVKLTEGVQDAPPETRDAQSRKFVALSNAEAASKTLSSHNLPDQVWCVLNLFWYQLNVTVNIDPDCSEVVKYWLVLSDFRCQTSMKKAALSWRRDTRPVGIIV